MEWLQPPAVRTEGRDGGRWWPWSLSLTPLLREKWFIIYNSQPSSPIPSFISHFKFFPCFNKSEVIQTDARILPWCRCWANSDPSRWKWVTLSPWLGPLPCNGLRAPPPTRAFHPQVSGKGQWGEGDATWSRATGPPPLRPNIHTYTHTHIYTHAPTYTLSPYNLVPTHPHNQLPLPTPDTQPGPIYIPALYYTHTPAPYPIHTFTPSSAPSCPSLCLHTLLHTHFTTKYPPPPIHMLIPLPPVLLSPFPPRQHPTLYTPLHTPSSSIPNHISCSHPSSPDTLIPYPT